MPRTALCIRLAANLDQGAFRAPWSLKRPNWLSLRPSYSLKPSCSYGHRFRLFNFFLRFARRVVCQRWNLVEIHMDRIVRPNHLVFGMPVLAKARPCRRLLEEFPTPDVETQDQVRNEADRRHRHRAGVADRYGNKTLLHDK